MLAAADGIFDAAAGNQPVAAETGLTGGIHQLRGHGDGTACGIDPSH
ncbi:MAG TPA: hypothetical protein VNE18_07950 [Rhodanobacter sp.]|nr:hypothetical protein [Rhodanobacter sp.]